MQFNPSRARSNTCAENGIRAQRRCSDLGPLPALIPGPHTTLWVLPEAGTHFPPLTTSPTQGTPEVLQLFEEASHSCDEGLKAKSGGSPCTTVGPAPGTRRLCTSSPTPLAAGPRHLDTRSLPALTCQLWRVGGVSWRCSHGSCASADPLPPRHSCSDPWDPGPQSIPLPLWLCCPSGKAMEGCREIPGPPNSSPRDPVKAFWGQRAGLGSDALRVCGLPVPPTPRMLSYHCGCAS